MPNKKHEDIHEKKEKEPHKGQPVGQNIHENIHSGSTPYGKTKKNQGITPSSQHQTPIFKWEAPIEPIEFIWLLFDSIYLQLL